MSEVLTLQRSAADLNARCIESFKKFLQAWHYSKSTQQNYSNFARRFSEFLGGRSFAEVTRVDVSEFRLFLFKQGFSSSSQAAAFFALRKLYDVLRMGDVVASCPPRELPTRKVGKRLPKSLSEKQVKKLLTAAASPRDLALLEFLYATGCRPAEAANMTVEDVNLPAGTATVRRGKDGDRVVCFGRPAARALTKYLDGRTSGPLFLQDLRQQHGSLRLIRRHRLPWTRGYRRAYWKMFWREWKEWPDGRITRIPRSGFLGRLKELPTEEQARVALRTFLEKRLQDEEQQRIIGKFEKQEKPLTTRSIGRIVKETALRAGLGNTVHPYQLRHSFASHCLHHDMNLRYLQHLLGHENLGVTQVYLHSTPDDLIRVHRKFFRR